MKAVVSAVCWAIAGCIFAIGLYLGFWVMLIGGIVGIVEACKVDPVSGVGIALGLLNVCFFSMPIAVSAGLASVCVSAASRE